LGVQNLSQIETELSALTERRQQIAREVETAKATEGETREAVINGANADALQSVRVAVLTLEGVADELQRRADAKANELSEARAAAAHAKALEEVEGRVKLWEQTRADALEQGAAIRAACAMMPALLGAVVACAEDAQIIARDAAAKGVSVSEVPALRQLGALSGNLIFDEVLDAAAPDLRQPLAMIYGHAVQNSKSLYPTPPMPGVKPGA
jgi:hypothetical protein